MWRVRSLGTSGRAVTSALAAMLIAGLATVTSDRPGAAPSSSAAGPQDHAALTTPWTRDVSPDNALPEYPRPQLRRAAWRNLNGLWQFAGASNHEPPPTGHRLP